MEPWPKYDGLLWDKKDEGIIKMELPTIMNTEKKKDEKVEALTDVEEVETKKDEKVKWTGDNYMDLPRLK